MNSQILDRSGTIGSIEMKSIENQCCDIGNGKKWTKSCPKCGKCMAYTTNQTYNKSIRLNRSCRSCLKMSRDFTGKRFGKLIIIKQYRGSRRNGRILTLVDCKCDCGNVLEGVYLQNVKRQIGCKKCQRRGVTKKPFGIASFNGLYNQYRHGAKARGYVFDLSKEEFMEITKRSCFYCGAVPFKVFSSRRCNGGYLYNGVDRKDNTKGYTSENSVTCCKFCNLTKNTTSFRDFISWIRRVYENTKNINLE